MSKQKPVAAAAAAPAPWVGPFDFDAQPKGPKPNEPVVILSPRRLYENDGLMPTVPASVSVGADSGYNLVVLADGCMYSYVGPFIPLAHSPNDRTHDALAGAPAYVRVDGLPTVRLIPTPQEGP